MKKIITTTIATAITALSFNVQAEGIAASPFTYLEYSVGTIDYDYTEVDDGDYSALSGSLELPMLLVPILSAELIDYDNFDITKLGAGSYLQFGTGTFLYGLIHYNDYSADDDDDSDFSLRAGVSHRFIDNSLEMKLEYITYTDKDSLDGVKLSAGYYFHPNFSVFGSYESKEYYDIMAVGAKVSF